MNKSIFMTGMIAAVAAMGTHSTEQPSPEDPEPGRRTGRERVRGGLKSDLKEKDPPILRDGFACLRGCGRRCHVGKDFCGTCW